MASTTNYKCPSCTGPLHFVGASGRLECDYCGSSFSVEEIDALYNQKVDDAQKKAESSQTSEDGIKYYNCTSCGARLFGDPTTVATNCPYCGNPTVIPGQYTNSQKPELIIPFALDKPKAIEALKNYYKDKKFLPKVFSSENVIEEIKGVYVPFWLFDGTTDVNMSFTGKTVHTSYSGNYETKTTKYYDVKREATIPFEKVPLDASKAMDDDQMDSLAPYDYSELKKYSPSYLPGFFAEAYDVSEEESFPRLDKHIEDDAAKRMYASVVGYNSVSEKSRDVKINHKKTTYAFFPVWLVNTKWNGQNFRFAMNGQTGKFVGILPLDKGKYARTFIGTTLLWTAILAPVIYLISNLFA